ncbi:unnamed protein product [Adineta steineri]|uniref:CCHC-type domain-containing protein n=1 Tax=Adineta steineri TaxID=433720 RepID=A0A813Y3P7_9BILA|nr:unnamed protein product [Adineta steineri]
MAKMNFKVQLEKLLNKELLSSSNDKNQIISGYKSLVNTLQIPQIGQQLHDCHDLLFECISQIILTPFNQYFDDEQLHVLLESASNACVLTMSQNQIIDGWLQNIEERTFEKPDNYEDDDDDDLYEDASESEEEEEEEKKIPIRNNSKKLNPTKDIQHTQKQVFTAKPLHNNSNPILTKPISNERNIPTTHPRNHQETNENSNRGARNANNSRGRGGRASQFDNKYGVDLRLYDCYNCGEYGHVQYDCPKKLKNSKDARPNVKEINRSKSPSIDINLNEIDQSSIQQVYNLSSKLLNSSQTLNERNQTFDSFILLIKKLSKQYGENLLKIFQEKESTFYPLICHIAQNDFLFTNDQYNQLYNLKHILLSSRKQNSLDQDRLKFCRQRSLLSLNLIKEHIENTTQIQQTIFNDFQEYIIRSKFPISTILFDLIKYIFQSNIYIDIQCFEYFTKRILFDMKKDCFSKEQFDELILNLNLRIKRYEINNKKQIWKERLNLFKNDKLTVDLNQWILELNEILKINPNELKQQTSTIVINHPMWYFAVLLMASSGHLTKEQYENLLKCAIQSPLFNSIQKFYFQFYLNQGHAPIMMNELKEIKIKLASNNIDEKKLGYEQIKIILERSKPVFNNEKIEQSTANNNDQLTKMDDIIPIIDNHILLHLISLVEMICSDKNTFSNEQCTELLDKFLQQSSIVRPLSNADQQRLKSYYLRPISLIELKDLCSSISSDLNDFLCLLKSQTLRNNDEIYDYLTQTIVNIFENQRKYSNEKCRELKDLIEKKTFGSQRYHLINDSYQKFRLNKRNIPLINPIILNNLLTNILSHDYQAHLDFFTLLEEYSQNIPVEQTSIEFEINRCLFSSIILIISEADFTNSKNIDFFRQRLKTIIDKQSGFFSFLLTEQQYKLVYSRLKSESNIDLLIESIKTNLNEENFINLINFIRNDLNDKNDFEKVIQFLFYTFDNEYLSIEQTLQISNLINQHSKFNMKSLKNLLKFLIELLQFNIHSSPKIFLSLIETKQHNDRTMKQILTILKAQNGKYAIADWKKTMIHLLTILFDRKENSEQLKDIAQQSPMFQVPIFKQQLASCWNKQSDENKISAIPKSSTKGKQSATHREMFHCLESNDPSMNALVVQQIRAYLIEKQLPTEISLAKFIQALETIIKNSKKFTTVSFDELATLISDNRGKIFSTDTQCDQLLISILFGRFHMSVDTLNSIPHLIQSRKAHERHDGLQNLLLILKNTQISKSGKQQLSNLPGISNQLYNLITRVVFDEKFNDSQVRQCLAAARNTYLLNNEHRQKLNEI